MNNFNPDQNPHILSSPETQEGGVGGINVPANQAETELSRKVVEEQEGLETAEQLDVEGGDGDITFNLESFDTLIAKTARDLELTDKPHFALDTETGLSLQGRQIEDLRTQLEALENDESTKLDVSSEIESNRIQERESLNNKLEQYKDSRTGINTKIQAAINQSNQPNRSIEDFISGNEELRAKVEELEQVIQKAEEALNDFDAETAAQLEQAIQDKKTELQQQLTEAQAGYTESGAEANDKKVLLERQLQEQLTNPTQLFSSQNIDQIFATYGIKEGLEKLEELKQESDQAREQAARDEIRKDIMSRVDWYNQIPELAEALSTDIQPKLEKLQESNPESDTIKEALTVEGVDRLDYLVNSGDPQLQGLAFWSNSDVNIDRVIAEHPKFAQYLAKETDKKYEQQQQEIRKGSIDGESYLGSQKDNARRVEIDNSIATQLERYRNTKIEELQGELSSLKYDETGRDYDTQDRAMLSEQEQLRPADIDKFRTELKTALESGQIKFEQGQFSVLENIPEKQQEINKQLNTLFDKIKPVLELAGYPLQSLESLSDIAKDINNDKQKADNKLFGLGKKQAQALESLAQTVAQTIEQYNTLQADKQRNAEQFENNNQSISKLKESYQKLPQSIQNSLTSLENPNFETITQTINIGVESIQNYQTPPEIAEKRSQIQAIESEIAKTRAITVPTSSTQSSL
ncbi:MAG: hypothetical protein RJB24_495 [Candidatus Parcubacteria bacterium]|jgi:chromosome segregation ATPase